MRFFLWIQVFNVIFSYFYVHIFHFSLSFCMFWPLKSPFLGYPIKIGCEEFIFIIDIEKTLDLGKKSCTFMIFKLNFELRPFWPFWSWNFENAAKCGLAYPNEPIHVKKIQKFKFKNIQPLIWPFWPLLVFLRFYSVRKQNVEN